MKEESYCNIILMPRHRRSEHLPRRLIERIKASEYSEFFGHVYTALGGGLMGARYLLTRPFLPNGKRARIGAPMDVQYTLKDQILTRTEFVRGAPSLPVHMAHFDPETGKRLSTVLDCF